MVHNSVPRRLTMYILIETFDKLSYFHHNSSSAVSSLHSLSYSFFSFSFLLFSVFHHHSPQSTLQLPQFVPFLFPNLPPMSPSYIRHMNHSLQTHPLFAFHLSF